MSPRRFVSSATLSSATLLLPVAALGAAGLLLAACGGSSTAGTTTTSGSATTTSSAGGATTTTSSGGGSSSSAKLDQIESAISKESSASFKLVYKTSGTGTPSTITIAQMPPKQSFMVSGGSSGSGGEMIYDGKKTYYCSNSSGGTGPVCISYGSLSSTPLASIVDVYSGQTAVTALKSWQSELAAGITGYHQSFSSASFAGQSAQCVSWTYNGSTAKYCVTNSGILAYVGDQTSSGSHSFQLESYSGSPSASEFQLPAGAKVESLTG
jgi:hypothetical protein